jgi:anti-sigma regulatory factor (Ser/Thr protein kinase)/ActR/RegA family two-component response regulator
MHHHLLRHLSEITAEHRFLEAFQDPASHECWFPPKAGLLAEVTAAFCLEHFHSVNTMYGPKMGEKRMSSITLRPVAVKDVLVVDPDAKIRALIYSILEPGAWAIHYAPNNQGALDLTRTKAFDLIVTSEKTSGREDIELLGKIRRARPHTRLIILANESTPADVIAAMRTHAFSYFSTPFSMETLAEMIRIAIEEPCWDDGIEVVAATPKWIRLMARCDLKTADRLLHFLNEIADLPDPERGQVATAFREMLLNAIEHGAGLDPTKDVDIEYVRARRMVTCRITDPGPGFILDEISHAAIANPDHDPIRHIAIREEKGMRPGGFGVLMARQLVDQIIYGQDGNEVLLVKYLPWADGQSA